jgi:hypothetical protein
VRACFLNFISFNNTHQHFGFVFNKKELKRDVFCLFVCLFVCLQIKNKTKVAKKNQKNGYLQKVEGMDTVILSKYNL